MTRLTAQTYTVAWLCALPLSELVVATAMLDEEHDAFSLLVHDENSYTYGSINGHNVVIACMPPGQPGKVSALKLVQPLNQSFPNLKIHLFVGIGSGVPRVPSPDNPEKDIHLGDVVIGWAEKPGVPGVVQWDLVRYLEDRNIEPLSTLDKPDRRILSALGLLLRNRILRRTRFPEHLKRLQKLASFSYPGLEHDKLFKSTYRHVGEPNCSSCESSQLTERLPRVNQDLIFHQGTIVSGDAIMNDPQRRDEISQRHHGALCFDMEAAGVMDHKRCLVIRGIADYADSHINFMWQNYAAGTAAAFAREFLFTIQPLEVNGIDSAAEIPLASFNTWHSNIAATSAPKVYFMVPFQRNRDLIGREEYIQKLETKLCVPNKHCRVALVGLGGIGKTRIALEYASKQENSDSVSVFWIHASTAERMEKAYREIAKEARLVGAEDPNVDQLRLVKKWLEREDSGKWVMIIDSADDEKLFFGEDEGRPDGLSSSYQPLGHYFPRRPNGSILLTTRNRKLGVKFAGARLTTVSGVIAIPEMSISESKSLLLKKLEENDYDDSDLTELVEILENLPLALVQAAAFIGENSQSIGEYLRTYRGSDSSKIKLLSQNFEDNDRDLESKNPVAVTWAISFEQIKRNNCRAAELLSLMSVFDREAIPKSLLMSDIEEVELEKALGTLKAFCLITPEKSRQAFSLHRLIYLATRNWLNVTGELNSWTRKALVLLSQLFPDGTYENREIWTAYLPHALTVLNSDQLPASENIAQAALEFDVSWAFRQKGDYNQAERMAQRSLDLREKVLGKKNLQTLSSLSSLAIMLSYQGKDEEAGKLHRRALSDYEKMLGKKHAETLKSKILGEEHPNTLGSIDNLALVLGYQGKYEAAERLHGRALGAREKILGEEHPDTLSSVDHLALVLGYQGKCEAAEELHRRALSAKEKILGKEHPDTLGSVNNLALVLGHQRKYEAAEELHRKTLSAQEKILGKEHPDTLGSVSNLAYLFHQRCQYQNALPLYQKACAAYEKTLGSDHRLTRQCAKNYSLLLDKMRMDSD
ncbi:hypothetical protein MMC22_011198 [Lobaria immixta]|nr:hypothetical protein [Lobaria immixta]